MGSGLSAQHRHVVEGLQLCSISVPLGKVKPLAKAKLQRVTTFLKENPLAKIVIVVDSHACQDGFIVVNTGPGTDVDTNELGGVRPGWYHSNINY